MNEVTYVKCACEHCGNRIAFPESGVGRILNCPHCGQPTRLTRGDVPAEEPEAASGQAPADRQRTGKPDRWVVIVGILLVSAGAALLVGLYVYHRLAGEVLSEKEKPAPPARRLPATSTPTNVETAPETREKSLDDLKVSSIALEKTPGTKIVHAVGMLTNDSTYERFGVTVELEVLDREGGRLGLARDYKNIVEPGQVWKFRAMVTDGNAESARVLTVNEQK